MDRDTCLRRVKLTARRRSTLELEILLARIVENLPWDALTLTELQEILSIFELDDQVLMAGLLGQSPAPAGADPAIWTRLLDPNGPWQIADHSF